MVKFRITGKAVENKDCANVANYIQENQLLPLCVDWPFDGNVMRTSTSYYEISSNGWTFSMPGKNQLVRFTDLVSEEKLVIVGNKEMDVFFELLEKSIRFHYGLQVQPIALKKFDDFVIYKLMEIDENTL